jgi:hypothetical protein
MHLVQKAAEVVLDGRECNAALDGKARLHWWSASGGIIDEEDRSVCLEATSNWDVVVGCDLKRVAAACEGVNAHAECFYAVTEALTKQVQFGVVDAIQKLWRGGEYRTGGE